MEKIALVLAVIVGFLFTNICCKLNVTKDIVIAEQVTQSESNNYGAYLAGRVAHLRRDLNASADYYMKAVDKMPSDTLLINQLYVMLTSQGRVDEAVKYADLAVKNNDKSPFIKTIKSVYEAKHQNYQKALDGADKSNNLFTRNLINPLLNAWFNAGLNQYQQAIKSLEPLLQDQAFHSMYLFHAGAISDYMQSNGEADKYYTMLINMKNLKISSFPMQVLSNFYLRHRNPDKINIIKNLADNKNSASMKKIINNIDASMDEDPQKIPTVITSPLVGIADALYGMAFIVQSQSGAEEISVLFASLANYANPDYDLPKILIGNVLSTKELYKEANDSYLKITPEQYSYDDVQFKIAKNYLYLEEYDKAEPIFLNLLETNPSTEIYLGLGEIMRANKRYRDATIYYEKALASLQDEQSDRRWEILLALGSIYEETDSYEKAEQYLRQALAASDEYIIKNYLGYSMLKHGKNVEEAFQLIVKAYNQSPDDGSIIDSLGWALYQLGFYEKAISYLEKASNASPSEAIIYNHLGDAYWDTGRKGEAVFQWNHAIGLKDSSNELDKNEVLQKINNGKEKHIPYKFDQEKIDEIMSQIE